MPVYDPANPVSLFYYFDAADADSLKGAGGIAIADGAEVHEWRNKGTSSAKFVQSGTIARPTWVASGPNGRPALRFNGAHALALDSVAGLTLLNGLTLFVIGSVDSTPADVHQALLSVLVPSGNATRTYLGIFGNYLRFGARRLDADGTVGFVNDGPIAAGERFIFLMSIDYTSALSRAYRNGIYSNGGTLQSAGQSASTAPKEVTIGGQPGLAGSDKHHLAGYIEAVGAVRSYDTADDLVPLHHYLRIAKGIG